MSNAYKHTDKQDEKSFRKHIVSYGPQSEFFNHLYKGCGFDEFQGKGDVRVLDAMAGPGRVGRDVLARFGENQVPGTSITIVFNDVLLPPLKRLEADGFSTIHCDVRELGKKGIAFNVAIIRYGLKDLPKGEQLPALKAIFDSLVNGGRAVIGDMFAPSQETQASVIRVHSTKQELAGRDPAVDGVCFIPTESEWIGFLAQAGFTNIQIQFRGTSDVDTQDWKGQFGPTANDGLMIARMNSVIREESQANGAFMQDFQVNFAGERVKLRFPILVAVAEKIQA